MHIVIKTFHIYFKPKRINLLFQPKVHLDRASASCAKNKLSTYLAQGLSKEEAEDYVKALRTQENLEKRMSKINENGRTN